MKFLDYLNVMKYNKVDKTIPIKYQEMIEHAKERHETRNDYSIEGATRALWQDIRSVSVTLACIPLVVHSMDALSHLPAMLGGVALGLAANKYINMLKEKNVIDNVLAESYKKDEENAYHYNKSHNLHNQIKNRKESEYTNIVKKEKPSVSVDNSIFNKDQKCKIKKDSIDATKKYYNK